MALAVGKAGAGWAWRLSWLDSTAIFLHALVLIILKTFSFIIIHLIWNKHLISVENSKWKSRIWIRRECVIKKRMVTNCKSLPRWGILKQTRQIKPYKMWFWLFGKFIFAKPKRNIIHHHSVSYTFSANSNHWFEFAKPTHNIIRHHSVPLALCLPNIVW